MDGIRDVSAGRGLSFCRVLLAMLVLGAAGCAPINFSVNIGGGDAPLDETVVMSDEGRPREKVALIDVRGVVSDGRAPRLVGRSPNPLDSALARLRHAEGDRDVKAVVLRVNSPGGTVTASDILFEEIMRFREVSGKPVVASLGEIATSGGYYIALAADEIVAQPTGITGSIGVIMPTFNVSGGLARLGVVARAITSGENKDIANPLEPMREGHYRILQELVDEMHERFSLRVRQRRTGISEGDFAMVTDGRVMTGGRAIELGLADRAGDIRAAFERAKALAGVERAKLVKLHGQGAVVRSAYASSVVEPPAAAGWGEVNLFQLRVDAQSLLGVGDGRLWYLWLPPGE